MRFALLLTIPVLSSFSIHGDDSTKASANDLPRATRVLDGVKSTFPNKSVTDGVKRTIAAIESCHGDDWLGDHAPTRDDVEKARKQDHFHLIFAKPVRVQFMGETCAVSEIIFAEKWDFLLVSGDKVMRGTKYTHDKIEPFKKWYHQTLPRD